MVKKKKLSRNAIIGYPAGIITGVTLWFESSDWQAFDGRRGFD